MNVTLSTGSPLYVGLTGPFWNGGIVSLSGTANVVDTVIANINKTVIENRSFFILPLLNNLRFSV
jgi:hypothetical protein